MKKNIIFSLLCALLLIISNNALAQAPSIIRGKIIDAATKETLPFVTVVEIDEKGRFVVGTTSDANGNYVIKLKDVKDSIQISFVGYKKYTFLANNRTKVDIELQQETQDIEEVKVVASKVGNDGITQVRDRATAVTRLETKEMKAVMSTTVEEMMQGRMGNVDITSVSGDPGAGLNIRIRGTASLNAKNNPLIVINGIPYDASFENFDFAGADVQKFGNLIDVSPEDIESIEVLKDAASTAVWGSRASNGVIMIKTKRGIKSKPIFDYTYKFTRAEEPDAIPMLDGPGYARLISEAHYNKYIREEFSTEQIAYNSQWKDYHNFSQNTDWVKAITQIAYTNQHDFSVRGGGDKSKYNMSVGFFDEGGTTIGNRLKKLTLRSSLDYELSKNLQFRTDIMYTRYDQDATFDAGDWWYEQTNRLVRSVAYRKMPNMSIYELDTLGNSNGQYYTPSSKLIKPGGENEDLLQRIEDGYYNPVAWVNLTKNKTYKDNTRALFNIKYTILPNLIYNSTVTLDIFDSKQSKFLPFKALGIDYYGGNSNKAVNEFNKKSSVNTINQFIFTPKLNPDHNLTLMTQFDTQDDFSKMLKVETTNAASPDMQQTVGDKKITYFDSNKSQYRSVGLFATANYIYKDKYIIMVGAKGEGNSKFSQDSRWGVFPTTSVAWRISNESFLKPVKFINEFKLRASWGQSGNLPDGNYLYYNIYNSGSDYIDMPGFRPSGMELTSLKWETIDQINLGFDLLILKERVNMVFDVYKKKTIDLYIKDAAIPSTSGFSTINLNDGEMENRGIEFSIDVAFVKTTDLQVDFNFNIAKNENTVLRLPKNYTYEYGNVLKNGEYKIIVQPGTPLGGFYGYRYLGVYATDADAVARDKHGNPITTLNGTPLRMIMGGGESYTFKGGDAKYDDVNHDGKIDELDIVYLGDLNPKFTGGGGLKVKFKNIMLNSFFTYKVGAKIINQTRMDTEKMYNHDNQSVATNWRWRREGDITKIPRALYGEGFNWLGSDRFVEDGTFIRLKTLSVSYSFNESFCKKIKVKELKVYTTFYNLYTWSNYSGQDPDVALPSKPDELPVDRSRTPPSIRVMFGANLTF